MIDGDIWVRDLDRGTASRHTFGEWPIGSDLMVVAVQPGDPFQIGTPVEIMSVNPRKGRWAPYGVNADETRFVWNAQVGGIHGPQPMTLVRNWQRLLE